jgi:SPW repeat-containing protein
MERLKHIVQINILLGAWLIVAPFVMGYSGSTLELANDVAIGLVFIGCSWWILAGLTAQVVCSTLELLGGLWLIATPFYFHYEKMSRVYTNNVVVGILAAMVAASATWILSSRLRRVA